MTVIAGDHMPDEWNIGDQIHLEVYARLAKLMEVGEHNALMFFANELIMDAVERNRDVTDTDVIALDNFLDTCLQAEHIIRKYLGANYITDYIETLEETDEQP
jgi:hypothetical protein